jgi:Arc/MetJ-type ribon-helix-helix transcriptional regulator
MVGKEKVSLTLDSDLLEAVRGKVGKRELSSFLNRALAASLQAEGLKEYLAQAESERGKIPDRVASAVDDAFEARHQRIRAKKKPRALKRRRAPKSSA